MDILIVISIIAVIILLSVIYNANNNRVEVNNRRKQYSDEFGKEKPVERDKVPDTKYIKAYYEFFKENNTGDDYFYIDEITWNDLNLDVFYNQMNTTLSSAGDEILYSKLHTISMNNNTPTDFFDKICEITSDDDKRVNMQLEIAKLGKVKGIDSFEVIKGLQNAKRRNIYKDFLLIVLLMISLGFIFVSPAIGVLGFILLLIVSISSYFKAKSDMEQNLRAFHYSVKIVRCAKSLNKISEGIIATDSSDFDRLVFLSFLIPKMDGTSSNPINIIWDYVRMIFHVDIIAYYFKLDSLMESHAKLIDLYSEIGKLDAQIAIGSYIKSVPKICKVEFDDGPQMLFDVSELYHPLTETKVYNSLSCKRGVLITGSNASGKSTFLKMVGISVVTAQSFGFVLASSARMSLFRLYSSMALKDNILGKESYYVVESKSLKRICDAATAKSHVICIVDEVLRGTNTVERIAASYEIMKYLHDLAAMCFVATHDTELTELLSDYYDLYYFAEKIEDGNVVFPYKIARGISGAGNAIRLLQMLGYPDRIVEGADNMVDCYNKIGRWAD